MVAKVLPLKARGLKKGQKEKARRAREKARRGVKEGQTQKRKARREREGRGLREGQKQKRKAREKRARRCLKEGQPLSLNTRKARQTGILFGKKGEARPTRLKGPKGQIQVQPLP